jgi:hypothetical protein
MCARKLVGVVDCARSIGRFREVVGVVDHLYQRFSSILHSRNAVDGPPPARKEDLPPGCERRKAVL